MEPIGKAPTSSEIVEHQVKVDGRLLLYTSRPNLSFEEPGEIDGVQRWTSSLRTTTGCEVYNRLTYAKSRISLLCQESWGLALSERGGEGHRNRYVCKRDRENLGVSGEDYSGRG